MPNALVGEFTIDEIFTDDLKDNSSYGYQSLAKYIEREVSIYASISFTYLFIFSSTKNISTWNVKCLYFCSTRIIFCSVLFIADH